MFFRLRKIIIFGVLAVLLQMSAFAQEDVSQEKIDTIKTQVTQLLEQNKILTEEYRALQNQFSQLEAELKKGREEFQPLEEKANFKTEILRQMGNDLILKQARRAYVQKETAALKSELYIKELKLQDLEHQKKMLEFEANTKPQ